MRRIEAMTTPRALSLASLVFVVAACGPGEVPVGGAAAPTAIDKTPPVSRAELRKPKSLAQITRSPVVPQDLPQAAPSKEKLGPLDDELRHLIDELAHDRVPFNAKFALLKLEERWPESRPWLLQGLDSWDAQQRHLCAYALMRSHEPPSEKLLEVAFESLSDDWSTYSQQLRRINPNVNRADVAANYLRLHPEESHPYLLRGFRGPDEQPREICAGILAQVGDASLHRELIDFFVPGLQDNRVRGDAGAATTALVAIGQPAVPALLAQARGFDDQAARLSHAILDQIEGRCDASSSLETHKLNRAVSLQHLQGRW